MKLTDLGLKTKPATKYFDHGYIKFRTENKELFDEIWIMDNQRNPSLLSSGRVRDIEHLKSILAIKSRDEVVRTQA